MEKIIDEIKVGLSLNLLLCFDIFGEFLAHLPASQPSSSASPQLLPAAGGTLLKERG